MVTATADLRRLEDRYQDRIAKLESEANITQHDHSAFFSDLKHQLEVTQENCATLEARMVAQKETSDEELIAQQECSAKEIAKTITAMELSLSNQKQEFERELLAQQERASEELSALTNQMQAQMNELKEEAELELFNQKSKSQEELTTKIAEMNSLLLAEKLHGYYGHRA